MCAQVKPRTITNAKPAQPKTPAIVYKIPYSSYCDTATAHNVWVCTCVAAPFLPAEGWTLGVAVAVHPPPPPKVMAQPPVGIGVGDGCGGGGGGLLAQSLGGFVP